MHHAELKENESRRIANQYALEEKDFCNLGFHFSIFHEGHLILALCRSVSVMRNPHWRQCKRYDFGMVSDFLDVTDIK